MKRMFLSEVQTEIDKSIVSQEVFSEKDIINLPEPVQRYFRYCGFIGKEKINHVKFVWDNVSFKMSPDKPWFKIKYEQYNFVYKPARLAYIYSTMFGIVPFEGRDKYLDGQGNMLGKLLKKVTLFNVKGAEINVSAAVTYLSESLIVPNCALQQYIKWKAIDNNHAKASIEYKGVKAEGIFTFNDHGEFMKFETDERYMDSGNGKSEKQKWTAELSNYIEKNDIKIPSKAKAIWNLPNGDYEYFKGTLTDIVYIPKK
ncbi:DUF6544 family protein [Desulfosporosinus nitroreducens]|uniref:Uncharacterized protein n=1 Tax=Desulfosporosinus nitroreducens TaxID=2018668 RepID=A0ABT8QME5_9FIRM|nr:DUF6544 family protein [Desulfosporosinus nitroreducens]MDO0822476.1 hypothetical protein [Desulfosporosinus nitroreducens]